MSNKTPYELRMDMVNLAYDYFNRIHDMNNSMAHDAFRLSVEQGKATWSEWETHAPKMFSFEDVVKKADELYEFVSKKDTK